ncbi:MAG: hypothetical protein UU22_C0005G0007 [Parcubacteria group bacterium GW2011_GWA2_40_8]|nr:MAG: hypothetical protein UU22_C0005G0007 [Parcubacteria group bacterium GW2011_GWA2_40_8]
MDKVEKMWIVDSRGLLRVPSFRSFSPANAGSEASAILDPMGASDTMPKWPRKLLKDARTKSYLFLRSFLAPTSISSDYSF